MLCDSSALIALLNVKDPDHVRCLHFAENTPVVRMFITLPCLTEAMYFLDSHFYVYRLRGGIPLKVVP